MPMQWISDVYLGWSGGRGRRRELDGGDQRGLDGDRRGRTRRPGGAPVVGDDRRGGSCSEEGLRRQWRGGAPDVVAVDLGQARGELGEEDDGGENAR